MNLIKKILVGVVLRLKIAVLFALAMRFGMKERYADGSDHRLFAKGNKYTLLALDADRYRGDLDVLAKSGMFRMLHLSKRWQTLLVRGFYTDTLATSDIINAEKSSDRINQFHACDKFITDVIRKLLLFIQIDCVISASYRYLYDYNITLAFEKLHIPYIMLYRECLLNVPRINDEVIARHSRMGKFHGSKIIVHNEICRSSFVSSGYCDYSRISVCGALRMDEFIRTINIRMVIDRSVNKRKKFTLFYFPYSMSLFGKNKKILSDEKYEYVDHIWEKREDLFRCLHHSILKMAKDNPHIDYVIKPKKVMVDHSSWEFYEKIISESEIDVKQLKNYTIEPDADVHKLIFESDAICALQSSTVLESAIAGKRVVFPLFSDYMKSANFNDFGWKDKLNLFDVAQTKEEFVSIVDDCFANPSVSCEIQNARRELFERYFYDLNGNSTDCYVNEILRVIES